LSAAAIALIVAISPWLNRDIPNTVLAAANSSSILFWFICGCQERTIRRTMTSTDCRTSFLHIRRISV